MHKVIIIGSGPAGYTAAIYTARAELKPLVLASSVTAGGELMNTTEVENFPGFPDGIQGPELMEKMSAQAEKFGAEIKYEDVESIDVSEKFKKVVMSNGDTYITEALIVATGSAYRKLSIPGEDDFSGKGVSWCATCDGFFFKEKTIAVIGGGDSAMEEAIFLTKFAKKVYLIHRRDTFRASKIMLNRAKNNEKIELITNSSVIKIEGKETVNQLEIINNLTENKHKISLDGVFVAIGNDPRTHLVHGKLRLTDNGTIFVKDRSSVTSVEGVFAAGDVIDPTYRQAVTAAASGTVAAMDVEKYLNEKN